MMQDASIRANFDANWTNDTGRRDEHAGIKIVAIVRKVVTVARETPQSERILCEYS